MGRVLLIEVHPCHMQTSGGGGKLLLPSALTQKPPSQTWTNNSLYKYKKQQVKGRLNLNSVSRTSSIETYHVTKDKGRISPSLI